MQIKTNLLKLVTAILDLFILFFIIQLVLGTYNSIIEESFFGLQLISSGFLLVASVIGLIISYYLFKIFILIDRQQFFTQKSLGAVKIIRNLFIISFFALLGIMPFVYYSADQGDAPGMIIMMGAIVFLPLAIAAFVSAMKQILVKAITMKDENDLTI